MTRAGQHAFGVESRWLDETTLEIPGGQHYRPGDYTVDGDYSQAAFPAVLGAVTGGVAITGLSEETLQGDAAILGSSGGAVQDSPAPGRAWCLKRPRSTERTSTLPTAPTWAPC